MIVRKLWPWESGALRHHLLRLGPEDRLMRFCTPASDRFIHAYCDRLEPLRMIVLGCFADGMLRGAAELIRTSDAWPVNAEIALSVERPFQDRGIGGELLGKALIVARNRLIDTVHSVFLPENGKMRRLLAKSGATFPASPAGGEARIALAWSGPGSVLDEMAMHGRALVAAITLAPCDAAAGSR